MKEDVIVASVLLAGGRDGTAVLQQELRQYVAHRLGAPARPEDVHVVADLPKTRNGKIMRRPLKDVAEGRTLGDTTTLADPAAVDAPRSEYEHEE